jgi:hypothetical protein
VCLPTEPPLPFSQPPHGALCASRVGMHACACSATGTLPPAALWLVHPCAMLAARSGGSDTYRGVQELDMIIQAYNQWGVHDATTTAVAQQMRH